jgi:DNA-binding protein H-NS
MATLKSLKTKIAQLQEQAKVIAQKESASVIAKIHALMDDHEITMDDLSASIQGKTGSAKSSTVPGDVTRGGSVARYRDPKSGATWSGHGRAPGWIANAKSRDKFLIDGSKSVEAPARKTARAGNYPRGPQPAKYRDPASGAEWSGRGKAPSWLASAKDRTAFLIAAPVKSSGRLDSGADKALATGNASAKKAAKKVATKKAAAKKGASAVKSAEAKKATLKAPVKKVASTTTATKKSAVKKVSANSVATGDSARKATSETLAKKVPTRKVAAKKVAAKKVSTVTAMEAPVQATEATAENIVS